MELPKKNHGLIQHSESNPQSEIIAFGTLSLTKYF